MSAILSFIGSLLTFLLFIALVVVAIAFGVITLYVRYQKISVKVGLTLGWSQKQVSLINQLQDVVKGYQESEKLVMLKVSSDVSSANQLAQFHQQSSMLLSAVGSMAQKFQS